MSHRTFIRPPEPSDEHRFVFAVARSHELHAPWTSPPETVEEFHAYLERLKQPANVAYLVCSNTTGEFVGVVNITNIVRGCFCSGYLGYYAFSGFERQGLMREGLLEVIDRAFDYLQLHRLEANIQPENLASIALVKSCGFQKEGYSPRYLKIGGVWRDHERWAILAD